LQPLLQNLVFIRKGAPGEYPLGMNYCEDAWRQTSCEQGGGLIGMHLVAKIDFVRTGTNQKNRDNVAYQRDRARFQEAFPRQKVLRDRSSWTIESQRSAEIKADVQPVVISGIRFETVPEFMVKE
jgi:hypothetical protein